jgi:hypothetical protein
MTWGQAVERAVVSTFSGGLSFPLFLDSPNEKTEKKLMA